MLTQDEIAAAKEATWWAADSWGKDEDGKIKL